MSGRLCYVIVNHLADLISGVVTVLCLRQVTFGFKKWLPPRIPFLDVISLFITSSPELPHQINNEIVKITDEP